MTRKVSNLLIFYCSQCRTWIPAPSGTCGTGYAVNSKTNRKTCYQCMAEVDRQYMRKHGKIVLYLVEPSKDPSVSMKKWKVTNWPGTLVFPRVSVSSGRHNIARTRQDVWFMFEGLEWHGVQYGEFSQLVHCRKTKNTRQ